MGRFEQITEEILNDGKMSFDEYKEELIKLGKPDKNAPDIEFDESDYEYVMKKRLSPKAFYNKFYSQIELNEGIIQKIKSLFTKKEVDDSKIIKKFKGTVDDENIKDLSNSDGNEELIKLADEAAKTGKKLFFKWANNAVYVLDRSGIYLTDLGELTEAELEGKEVSEKKVIDMRAFQELKKKLTSNSPTIELNAEEKEILITKLGL